MMFSSAGVAESKAGNALELSIQQQPCTPDISFSANSIFVFQPPVQVHALELV